MSTRRGHHEGTIYYRADRDRYCLQVSAEGGKRKTLYFKTKAEAQHRRTQLLYEQAKGLPLVGERQTVTDYLASWLAIAKPAIRPGTWRRYEAIARLHLMPTLGRTRLSRLTPQQVQHLYAEKLAAGVTPSMVRYIHRTLRRALNEALQLNLVQRNVCEQVKAPRPVEQEMHILSREQARQLLDTARGDHDRLEALFVLALDTGMRSGEILALKWEDVDLDKHYLRVRSTLQQTRGGFLFAEPKTKSSRRQIALTQTTVAALRAHRAQQIEERLALGTGPEGWQEHGLVFPRPHGEPMDGIHLLRAQLHRLLRRAGLPQIRFHDLRHTSATLLLAQRVNPKVVSERLGHTSVSITLNIYAHVLPDMQQDAAQVMETLIG